MNKVNTNPLSAIALTAKISVEEVFLSSATTGKRFTSECEITAECFTANLTGKVCKEVELEARTLGSKLRSLRCAQTALAKRNNLGLVRKAAVVEIPANVVHAIVEEAAARQLHRHTERRDELVDRLNALKQELAEYDANSAKEIGIITKNRDKALKNKKPVTVHI